MLKYLGNNPKPVSSGYSFKLEYTFEQRLRESSKIKEKYKSKIPVILEKSDNSFILPDMKKKKVLVGVDINIGQFIFTVRKNLKIDKDQAIFIFVNNQHIPSSDAILGDIYNKYKDKDGFLYITYSTEHSFG